MKLRLVGSSLLGHAFTWYLNLPPNSIQDWNEMETVFIDQYDRSKPEITINGLTYLKQHKHETDPDFIARFKKIKMKCKIPLEEKHFIKIAQNALRISLRKRFDYTKFVDLQDIDQRAGKYELLLKEEIQRKNTSKSTYLKTQNPIHHMEIVEGLVKKGLEHINTNMAIAEIVQIKTLIAYKVVIKPSREQMNKSYSFELSKVESIFDELMRAKMIQFDDKHVFTKPEEVKGKSYYK